MFHYGMLEVVYIYIKNSQVDKERLLNSLNRLIGRG